VPTFPVVLTFDVDGETMWLNRDPASVDQPITMSQGRYGPTVGLPRILALLDSEDIRATFFVPGWIADHYPDAVAEIGQRGHEVAHHGYRHEWPQRLDPEEEQALLLRGIEAIRAVVGYQPVGYRAPGWELSPTTLSLLVRHGFRYSSNFMDRDGPYVHDQEPIVELPVSWSLADSTFFRYGMQLPGARMATNDEAVSIWCGELDALSAEDACLVLTLHPELSGRPYRLAALRAFIEYARRKPGIRFVRAIDLADEVSPHPRPPVLDSMERAP
jgi:peptidoglycan-N-acetylglucosamine deacetylase